MNDDAVDLSISPNLLLQGLSTHDRRLLEPLLKRRILAPKMLLEKRNTPLETVHFIEEGLAAVLTNSSQGHLEGIGIIGRSGMTAIAAAIGIDRSPYDTVVLIGGCSLSIDRVALQEVMYASRSLRNSMLRFHQAFLVHIAQMALAKSHGNMKVRLACWLLMAHDRILGDEMPLTHETISLMLGVRRASITVALHELEGDRVIHSLRGWIVIRDRSGLEKVAGQYYGSGEKEYERLMGMTLTRPGTDDREEVSAVEPLKNVRTA